MAGFFGNVGSAIILSGKGLSFQLSKLKKVHYFVNPLHFAEMRNSFNWLLIGLACFDNIYLLGSILESFRKDFGMVSFKDR